MAAVVTAPHRHGGPGTALDKMASHTSLGLEAQYPSARPAYRPQHVGHWMRRPSVTSGVGSQPSLIRGGGWYREATSAREAISARGLVWPSGLSGTLPTKVCGGP